MSDRKWTRIRQQKKDAKRGRPGAAHSTADESEVDESAGVRLNRYMARAGVASRRKSDELIAEGRVKVNGEVVTDFSTQIRQGDVVEVGGSVISPQTLTYLLLNKPADTITTKSDEKGRRTVLDLVRFDEETKSSLFPVGRLDRNTVGTLLLTNDGELAHRLMHPRYKVQKIYLVRTKEPVKPHEIDMLKRGVEIEGGPARAERVTYPDAKDHRLVAILLHEGRNKQIRRMMEALGHEVTNLERINYAGLNTEGLRRGRWRKLEPHEVQHLRHLVKLR